MDGVKWQVRKNKDEILKKVNETRKLIGGWLVIKQETGLVTN